MTPAQINAAIAEWMGWTSIRHGYGYSPEDSQKELRGVKPVPNYHGDLNACAKARSRLTEEQQWTYVECLGGMATHKNALWRLTNATAPEHCETLLRTLNLWKE